jgi:predicted PurR-regulated permease PerM
MIKDKKGQALIEFILIIPIFLILVFALIDFGNILYKRYKLENDLDYIVDLYNQGLNDKIAIYVADNGMNITYEDLNQGLKIILTKNVNIMTPGLRVIINSPYTVRVERVIYDE